MSSTPNPNPSTQIILITGANRGIGLAILHSLALALPSSTLLLGCRSPSKGTEAITSLRAQGIPPTTTIVPIALDVSDPASLASAAALIESQHGRLDTLINNAGCAVIPPDPALDPQGYRDAFARVHDVNVAGLALCTALLLPLLRKSADARVINVSSGRASMRTLTLGNMPAAVSVPYSVSKVAVNALTVEMAREKGNEGVVFLVVNPGHCRTEFNGFRGTRDPMEGAVVVVECVVRPRGEVGNAAFWETKGSERELVRVEW